MNSGGPGAVRVIAPGDTAYPGLAAVIELGDRWKKTLGLFPHSAYKECERDGNLLVAVEAGELLGYTVFSRRRRIGDVKLIHVCVAEGARRSGVAKAMVDQVSARHPDAIGITAYCRRDYGLSQVWERLGFRWMGDRPRESAKVLAVWHRSHGHMTLFDSINQDGDDRLVVAVDTNVLSDIASPTTRAESSASAALMADWLDDEIDVVYTASVANEAAGTDSKEMRAKLAGTLAFLRELRIDTDVFVPLHEEISELVTPEEHAKDASLERDIRHLAEAIAAGADVLVTNDANAIRVLSGPARTVSELVMVGPSEVIGQIDQVRSRSTYQPLRLQETNLAIQKARGGEGDELINMLNNAAGERLSDFQRLLRDTTQDPRTHQARWLVRDPDSRLLAVYTIRQAEGRLEVPLFRIARSSLRETLTRQLLRRIRLHALEADRSSIAITDPLPPTVVSRAAVDDGFVRGGTVLVGRAISKEVRVSEVADLLKGIDIAEPTSMPMLTAIEAFDLEHRFWPLRIVDAQLPCYIVPIRLTYAADLLCTSRTLFGRDTSLGLSLEHIYYRAPVAIGVRGPGRILWYESSDAGQGAITAVSHLEAVERDTPESLHGRYGRFGVWKLPAIREVSRGGQVEALRFRNTQLLEKPVSRAKLNECSPTIAAIQAPRLINTEQYEWLINAGRQ